MVHLTSQSLCPIWVPRAPAIELLCASGDCHRLAQTVMRVTTVSLSDR
jgi:hypothetical protein